MANFLDRFANMGWRGQLIGGFSIIFCVVMLPSFIILIFGMLPTFAAYFTDPTRRGTIAVTVGAMNSAGCAPFLMELWTSQHTPEHALEIITNPKTIIIMYLAALIGYLINWAMTGIVMTVIHQKGQLRIKEIDKKQEQLVKRWGEEVTGDIALDQYGFPLNRENSKPEGE